MNKTFKLFAVAFIFILLGLFAAIYAPILENSNVYIYDFKNDEAGIVSAKDLELDDSLLSLEVKKQVDKTMYGFKHSRLVSTVINSELVKCLHTESRFLVRLILEGPTKKETDFIFIASDTVVFEVYSGSWMTIEDLEVSSFIAGANGEGVSVLGKSSFHKPFDSIKIFTGNPGHFFIQSNKGIPILVKSDNK